jgi:RimJ/RimL family protein N-acetyltransferase
MQFDNYTLRLPVSKDASLLLDMILSNKERLVDYFPVTAGSVRDMSSTKKFITEKIKQAERKDAFAFIIIDNLVSRPIGFIFIKNTDWHVPKAELAYFIDKDYEGKGIISKGLKLVINYSFDRLKIRKLFLRAAKDNKGSQYVAIKNGFRQEGTLRNDFRKSDGTLIDLYYYGLVKEDIIE